MRVEQHLDPAHANDLAQVAFDEMHHLSWRGVENDGYLHGVAEPPCLELINGEIAPRKRHEDSRQQTSIDIGDETESNGLQHGNQLS